MTETPERPKLLPCPFCGSTNVVVEYDGRDGDWYIQCQSSPRECPFLVIDSMATSREQVIEAWNRRASSLGEPVSQEAPWVVWSHERNAWWRANRQGYAGSLFGAGVYSEDEAKAIEADSHRGDVARLLVDEFERQSRVVGTGANWLRTQLAASRSDSVEAKPQNPCVVFGCECSECSASVISSASPLSEEERLTLKGLREECDSGRKIYAAEGAFLLGLIDRLSASAPSPEDKGSDT